MDKNLNLFCSSKILEGNLAPDIIRSPRQTIWLGLNPMQAAIASDKALEVEKRLKELRQHYRIFDSDNKEDSQYANENN